MIDTFQFRAPTDVVFGCGSRSQVSSRLTRSPCGVLSSPTVLRKTEVAEILNCSRKAGVNIIMLGTVSPNPRLAEVTKAYEAATSSSVRSVLAIGGGSVIDAGKLLRVALTYRSDPRNVLDDFGRVVGSRVFDRIDLVAVPTTAGTGAEVSKGAIITDDATSTKKAARGSQLIPDDAIIDPELSLSLSPRRTAETGFDVITHAVETLLSRGSNPVTDVLARSTLSAAPAALRRSVADGTDLHARETLALHSWLMGYNLAHASTCLPHRMQYPIGSLTDTSHQIGLAALYPAWITRAGEAAPDLVRSTIGYLAPEGADVSDPPSVVRAFLADIGLTTCLRDLGIEEHQLSELAQSVSGRVDLDPIDPAPDDILQLFREAFN